MIGGLVPKKAGLQITRSKAKDSSLAGLGHQFRNAVPAPEEAYCRARCNIESRASM